jgi:hypothetical protein
MRDSRTFVLQTLNIKRLRITAAVEDGNFLVYYADKKIQSSEKFGSYIVCSYNICPLTSDSITDITY